jgi:hypothetical protein
VAQRGVQRRDLEHRQHRGQRVVALRASGRGDGPVGSDDQGGDDEQRGDVVVQLLVGRVNCRVAEFGEGGRTVGIEPDVVVVYRPMADPGTVEFAEDTPDRVEHVVVDVVGRKSCNVWSYRVVTRNASSRAVIPTATSSDADTPLRSAGNSASDSCSTCWRRSDPYCSPASRYHAARHSRVVRRVCHESRPSPLMISAVPSVDVPTRTTDDVGWSSA